MALAAVCNEGTLAELAKPSAVHPSGRGLTRRFTAALTANRRRLTVPATGVTPLQKVRNSIPVLTRICLWETDPTRFDLEDQEDLRYLCRILANRMWQVWKAEVGRGVA